MSIWNALIYVLCAVGVILLLCWLVLFVERKLPWPQYDERQRIARGNGYRMAFIIGVIYFIGVSHFLWIQGNDEPVISTRLLVFIGLALQIMSFHIYCLLTHSALPFDEKPTFPIIAYLALGLWEIMSVWSSVTYGRDFGQTLLPDGMVFVGYASTVWIELIMAVCSLSLAIMYLTRALRKEKE